MNGNGISVTHMFISIIKMLPHHILHNTDEQKSLLADNLELTIFYYFLYHFTIIHTLEIYFTIGHPQIFNLLWFFLISKKD